jgi:hypothetical protein
MTIEPGAVSIAFRGEMGGTGAGIADSETLLVAKDTFVSDKLSNLTTLFFVAFSDVFTPMYTGSSPCVSST